MLAAGAGARFGAAGSGSSPATSDLKQYAELAGRRVLDWSLEAARTASDGVVLVVQPGREDDAEPLADFVVAGGATRSASVRSGLAAVPDSADVIVVHDAARPLASPALFVSVVSVVREGAAAAIPVVPVTDTVKRVRSGEVVETVDRSELVAAQTPQAFRASVLRAAHAGAGDAGEGPDATDDAALLERLGEAVLVVPGDALNIKITRPEDLALAQTCLATGLFRSG